MFPHIIRPALLLCLVMLSAGCVSSRPPSPHAFHGKSEVAAIDATIKRSHEFWTKDAVSKTGADENGFTVVEFIGREQKTFTVESYGKFVSYKWADVDEVSIRAMYANSLFCGILDPTGGSCVRIKFRDGKIWDIHTKKLSMSFFPFWLFSTELARADQIGSAAQTLVDSQKKHQRGDIPVQHN